MVMSNKLQDIIKGTDYLFDGRSVVDCDWGLLLNKPDSNTSYFAISDEETEMDLGLKYIYDCNNTDQRKEFLPRGKTFNRKVAFLDRDGILIEDTDYPGKKEDVIFMQGILPLLKTLKEKGFDLIVVTNQSGISRGKYSVEDYLETTDFISSHYESLGVPLLDTFYCPFHVDGIVEKYKSKSLLRKPMPGMIIKAAEKHQVDLSQSVMIGDKLSDILKCSYMKYFIKNKAVHPDCYENFVSISRAISNL